MRQMEAPFVFKSFSWLLCLNLLFGFLTPGVTANQKVVGGTTVNPPHKYPWMVEIWFNGCSPESDFNCTAGRHYAGGVVLSKYWILSSARVCYSHIGQEKPSAPGLFVYTGLHVREKLEPWSQNLSIVKCIPHEGFRSQATEIEHDIALLRVNKKIIFRDKVTPANLPTCDFDIKKDGEVMATMIGWGIKSLSDFEFAKELQEVDLPLLRLGTCQRTWSHFYDPSSFVNESLIVTDSMLCAGHGPNNARPCALDGGGPLMTFDNTTRTYTVVGILPWRTYCTLNMTNTVFTQVSSYLGWIKHQTRKCRRRTYQK